MTPSPEDVIFSYTGSIIKRAARTSPLFLLAYSVFRSLSKVWKLLFCSFSKVTQPAMFVVAQCGALAGASKSSTRLLIAALSSLYDN